MPTARPWPCRQGGCSTLVYGGGYCALHSGAYKRLRSERRAATVDDIDRLYKTSAWRNLRAAVLRQEPLCRECQRHERVVAAVLVDHITPARTPGVDFFDRANLQPLCNDCHERKSQRDGSRQPARGASKV